MQGRYWTSFSPNPTNDCCRPACPPIDGVQDVAGRPDRFVRAPWLFGQAIPSDADEIGSKGTVRPTAPRVEIQVLFGWKLDREGARSPRLALCLLEKAMAAARNRERSGGEASPDEFGLTTPVTQINRARTDQGATMWDLPILWTDEAVGPLSPSDSANRTSSPGLKASKSPAATAWRWK